MCYSAILTCSGSDRLTCLCCIECRFECKFGTAALLPQGKRKLFPYSATAAPVGLLGAVPPKSVAQIQADQNWHRLPRNGAWIRYKCQVPALCPACLFTIPSTACTPSCQNTSQLPPPCHPCCPNPVLAEIGHCQPQCPQQHGEADACLCTNLFYLWVLWILHGIFVTLFGWCKGRVPAEKELWIVPTVFCCYKTLVILASCILHTNEL